MFKDSQNSQELAGVFIQTCLNLIVDVVSVKILASRKDAKARRVTC